MSDKSSDKKYRITLTEKQFALVGDAVELMIDEALRRKD